MTTDVTQSIAGTRTINLDLIDRCKKGDQGAQFKIYRLYYKAMLNTSLRIVKNSREAEDIMQESFLSAFEKIDTWPGTESFPDWLNNIVIDRSVNAIRTNNSTVTPVQEPEQNFRDKVLEKNCRDEEDCLNDN